MLNNLPEAHNAELVVLATALLEPDAMVSLSDSLKPSDFGSARHRIYLDTMLELLQSGSNVDMVTFTDKLQSKGLVSARGASDSLTDILDSLELTGRAVPLEQLGSYVKIVRSKATLRQLSLNGQRIQALSQSEDATKALQEAQGLIMDLSLDADRCESLPLAEATDRAYEQLKDSIENPDKLQGISTGYDSLDRVTKGLKPGELVVLAGRPGMGKSTLALNIVLRTLKAGLPVVFFSLEMTQEQLLQKLIQAEAYSELELPKLSQAREIIKALPLIIIDQNPMTVSRMHTKIRQAQLRFGSIGLVIADHMQLLASEERGVTSTERMTAISGGLKGLAMTFKVPVLALSQLNRGLESRSDKHPMMSDLRDSGAIEQDAGLVLLIYRDDYYNKNSTSSNVAEINVAKNRYGRNGLVELLFRPELSWFGDKPNDSSVFPLWTPKEGKK